MDSRERVNLALGFEEPDRVPVDLWMSDSFKLKVEAAWDTETDDILDSHDIDFRYIEGPRYIGPPLASYSDGSDEDIWGVSRRLMVVSTEEGEERYKEIARSPLASATTVDEIVDYDRWPSADWFDYSGIEAQCDAVRDKARVAVFMGDRLNRVSQLKPAMYLRGMEQIFVDMRLNPEMAHQLFRKIRAFYLDYAERIFEAASGKLDMLLMGDDFGSQTGPLMSPVMWSSFLEKGFAAYIEMAKGYGIRVMHHTCGDVRSLIPSMIERGLDVLQSVQPEPPRMVARELKAEFGNRIAFHGGISIQNTMPFGTPEAVRAEVRDRIESLAPGGGFILCTSHNLQADTPLVNLTALLSSYDEFGRYR